MPVRQRQTRAFEFHAGGVRVAGTIVACDTATGGDLILVSRAIGLGQRVRPTLPRAVAARRQILVTETTLALLGAAGDRLRPQALVAAFGRPFALGSLRVELFSSGHLPGAASLRCEWAGRSVVYAGAVGPRTEVRKADAVCVEARLGIRELSFSEPPAAWDELADAVRAARLDGLAPVVLVDGALLAHTPDIARAIESGSGTVRAPSAILGIAEAYGRADLNPPRLRPFTGRLAHGEALLWPASARGPTFRGRVRPPGRILVSPFARQPAALDRFRAARGVAAAVDLGFEALLDYIEATRATEVAVTGAPGDDLVDALRARGRQAYRLGPPRQIELFCAK
jgi:putative mRNA 3-end processing factor